MFSSVAFPGILPARPKMKTRSGIRPEEKVHASMTADKSSDAQSTGTSLPLPDDAGALSMLYEQFRRPIHSYIYRLLGNSEDADDVTQEVSILDFVSWQN